VAWNSTSPEPILHTRPITSTNYLINHNVTNSLSAVLTPSLNSHTPPPKHLRILQQYSPGELGKWAMSQAQLLAKLGSTTTTLCAPEHPFLPTSCSTIPTPTGLYWGPKFLATLPWPITVLDQVYEREAHVLASKHHAQFLIEDMFDYVQMGYWAVLSYQAVRHIPELRLSPSGVVPQKEHHPRPIMDYLFYMV
jgi:hypothetical protein